MSDTPPDQPRDEGPLVLLSSRFAEWLESVDAAVALATYEASRLFLVGRRGEISPEAGAPVPKITPPAAAGT